MTEADTLGKIRELASRLAELTREGEARTNDAAVQARLSAALRLLAREQAGELERVGALYRESARQLERHRKRMAVTVHDLKAPITISLLNLELLAMESDAQQSAFYLTGVRRELEFMLDTIANLLELERAPEEQAEFHFEPVALGPLVDGVIERMAVLIQDKPELHLENALPAGLPALKAHPHRLTRVFNNLFSNSIKYTEAGHVRISVEPPVPPGTLCIVVEDTGSGIDPERIPRLFDYYQGDDARPDSTGIGLAFVRQVVDAHQGKVWMESQRGVGTRVFLQLPVWDEWKDRRG